MGTRGRYFIAVRRGGKTNVKSSTWRRHDAYPRSLGRDLCTALDTVKCMGMRNESQVAQIVSKMIAVLKSTDEDPEEVSFDEDAEKLIQESQRDVFCEHVYGIILHEDHGTITIRYSNKWLDDVNTEDSESLDVELTYSDFKRFVKVPESITPENQHLYPPWSKKKRKACEPAPAAKKKNKTVTGVAPT